MSDSAFDDLLLGQEPLDAPRGAIGIHATDRQLINQSERTSNSEYQ